MSTLPVRRSTRVRSGTQRVPALTPDDSDYDPFDADSPPSPHTSHQPKKTKRTRKPTMSRAFSGPSPPFGDGSSHRGKNVVRHDQLRRHAACSSCRRRRTKCDAVKPVCGACVRHRNYLRRSSKGAAVEVPDDCGCVYERDDGDSGSRRGSKSGSTEHVDDAEAEDEPSLPARSEWGIGARDLPSGSGRASSTRRSSRMSESEVIITPALELSEEAVDQMRMADGGSVGMSDPGAEYGVPTNAEVIGSTTCDYSSSAHPSFPSEAPLPKPNQTQSLPYPRAYYPLPSLPVHSAPHTVPQSFDQPGVHLPDYSPYPFSFPPHPNPWQGESSSTPPSLSRLDTFPRDPLADWATSWTPDSSVPPNLFHSNSAPDFSLSSRASGMGERSFSSDAYPMAQSLPAAPPHDDLFHYSPVGNLREISYDGMGSYPTFDFPQAGKADGNDSGLAAAQRGWIPGSLGFGGAPGEGWAQGSFEERMAAAGTAPGPLSPDQLFAMMQLLGNQVGPMV